MAEIISRKKGGKKNAPRVDLTPMVDLGFLLITFFIITTSMTKPVVTIVNSPADGAGSEAAASKTITFILVNNNKVLYYQGNDSLHCNTCNYAASNSLREVISEKQIQVEKKFGKKSETVVLIKPTAKANYSNVVAVLDEMLICNITRYMILNTNDYVESLAK